MVRFTIVKGQASVDDIIEFGKVYDEIVGSLQGKYVFVADTTQGNWLSFEARITFGQLARELEDKYIDRLMVNYLVINNPLVHTVMKGINIFLKPKVPQYIFETLEQALEVANSKVKSF